MDGPWKVGELAKATGVTVRALHHYDERGLLRPSGRTESGHRLYTKGDVERLQHLLALRQLGFSLDQAAEALRRPRVSPLTTFARLRRELRERRAAIDALDERLAAVERDLAGDGEVSTERLLRAIERMIMYEKYLTTEQLARLRERAATLGRERLRESTEEDWPKLVAAVSAEEAKGSDPADPRVQALARRWTSLTEELTGPDPGISAALRQMYAHDADAFAADKVGAYGEAAVADLARCVRYIARALEAGGR